MHEPRISFIVAVHNCLDLTRSMIRSLEDTVDLSKCEVILIDDASGPDTAKYVQTLKAPYNTLRNETNLGFSASNNKAAHHATGTYLVFLNNDLEFAPGWLEPMLELECRLPKIGAIGNIQKNFQTGLIDHAGIFFDPNGMPTHAWKNRKKLPKGDWKERSAITAACLLMKRSLFEEMNGFDESYRNGMEDVDLCLRLRIAGYRLIVSHKSVIRHHISSSPGRHEHNDRNSELFRQQWSNSMRKTGIQEWPEEYFHRYARYWWRMNPRLAWKALFMLLFRR
ncbi:MAG: glycosyltransferase family 2 protein [Opitutales bacterium]|jgi:O-antigen biosynthesis protein|nr:glycosyltransferase family 2 protein [Opitutales bacterium]